MIKSNPSTPCPDSYILFHLHEAARCWSECGFKRPIILLLHPDGEAVLLQQQVLKGFHLQVLGSEHWVLVRHLFISVHNGEPSPDSPCFLQQLTSAYCCLEAPVVKFAAHRCSGIPFAHSSLYRCKNIGRLSWDPCARSVIITSLFGSHR